MRSFIICTLYQILIRVIKPRRTKWAEHGAWMGKIRNTHKILIRKPDSNGDYLSDLGNDERII
jgi:hypothetical protein